VTTIVLTTGTTWLVPVDWNNTSNTVYCIGAGGTGSAGGGGGGGACAFTANIGLVPGAIVSYQLGVGGGSVGSGTSPTTNTWFGSSALVAAGGATSATVNGAAGGSTSNSAGGTKYAGGAGGTYSSGAYNGSGGGAAGSSGAGAAGANASGSLTIGGQGDNSTGGTGGTGANGGNGGNGTEISGGVGAGGGGAGTSVAGGAVGGSYGGGGGGGAGSGTGGAGGAPGVIIIVYTSVNVGYNITPEITMDSPAFIAHKINPHLMADRNYDDMGALYYAMSQVPVTPSIIFWADGDMLPQRPQYVEANSQRYNALYGAPYTDVGAFAYAAFIIPATTPKIRYDPAVTDILPLQGYIERQTQLFSMLRGQAYDDTGAREYGAFIYPAPTPKQSFGADGGLLPIGQYVEAQAQRFSMLRGQAYDDTGARHYAAITLPVTPATLFSADGSMMPQDSLGTMAKLIRFGSLYNVVVFSRPPVFAGLMLIPNIFFVSGNEFISDLNATINAINYDLQILNISRSYFFPLLKDLHPNGFADTLNILVKLWNALPPPMGITPTNKIKQFLSVGAPELTLAVNALIDDMNVFIIALQAYT